MQFDKPPLLELVAELKWLTVPSGPGQLALQRTMPQPILAPSVQEEFFSAFGKESALSGWTASERLAPSGFPLLSYVPALRVRSFKDTESQMIYQVGPGIFSAHALPPYKNWESFRPFAERGLEHLLKARVSGERESEFFSVTLRYMDLFTPELVGDMPVGRFLTEVLGFSLSLPAVLNEQIRQGETAAPTLSLLLPLESGLKMRLSIVGSSIVGDKKGILMDTAVSTQRAVVSSRDAVLAVWENAHSTIRKTFVGLTTKLHSEMIPIAEG